MPRIKDIVDEALQIVFNKLEVGELERAGLLKLVSKKTENKRYYERKIGEIDPEVYKERKRLAQEKAQQIKINLSCYNDFETQVMQIVCDVHKVSIADFILYSRKREFVEARFQFAATLLIQFHYTYMKVGELLNKDHSTIIHSIRQHCDFYDTIANYKTRYNQVLNRIEQANPGIMTTTLNPNIVIQMLNPRQRRLLRNKNAKNSSNSR
jgi:chromosomal replication initiation ATPase DnaA